MKEGGGGAWVSLDDVLLLETTMHYQVGSLLNAFEETAQLSGGGAKRSLAKDEGASEASSRRAGGPCRSELLAIGFARLIIGPLGIFLGVDGGADGRASCHVPPFPTPWLATLVPCFALERRIRYAQFITLLSLKLGKEGRKAGGAVKPLSLTSPVQHNEQSSLVASLCVNNAPGKCLRKSVT